MQKKKRLDGMTKLNSKGAIAIVSLQRNKMKQVTSLDVGS